MLIASRLGNVPGLDQHRAAIKRIVDIGNQEFIPKIQQAIEKMKADLTFFIMNEEIKARVCSALQVAISVCQDAQGPGESEAGQ